VLDEALVVAAGEGAPKLLRLEALVAFPQEEKDRSTSRAAHRLRREAQRSASQRQPGRPSGPRTTARTAWTTPPLRVMRRCCPLPTSQLPSPKRKRAARPGQPEAVRTPPGWWPSFAAGPRGKLST